MLTKEETKEDLTSCHSVLFLKNMVNKKKISFFLNQKPSFTEIKTFMFMKRGSCFCKEKGANRKKHKPQTRVPSVI